MRTGSGLPGHVHLLEALGQARHRDVLEPELFEHPDGDAELALAAVDEHEVGRVGEALAAAGALVALLEVATEAPGQRPPPSTRSRPGRAGGGS